jgi:UDP-N-acetylmuramoyl-L-alanyl-D-glutamate--2,6-diaminopimelate ligase
MPCEKGMQETCSAFYTKIEISRDLENKPMSKPLHNLIARLPNAAVSSTNNPPIAGITHDSRAVGPGWLFVCLIGQNFDGHRFAPQAVEQGAAAVVAQQNALETLGITLPPHIPIVEVPDTRKAFPLLACAFYDDPSHALKVIGVTGTNGKTTTTRMIANILRTAGERVGTIGTLGAELDGAALPSEHTTPEADQLQELLATMRDQGADSVVMEVSSHALALYRTDGIAFRAGVFTNLTQDHLDFHKTMEAYFHAKARLFTEYPVLYPRPDRAEFISVINVSQWEGRELVTLARGDIITYSVDAADPAVLRPESITLSATSTRFVASYDSGTERFELPISVPLGGAFQVGNALAAIATCLRLGVDRQTIVQGLATLPPVPGRFEPVPTADKGFSVIVDYAHTPDGLQNLLQSALRLQPKRLLCVFGCGGNRDRGKRPIMGHLAATMSDIAIITSDNPRHEDPNAIIQEILAGIDPEHDPHIKAQIIVEPDRRAAIYKAVALAQPGDMVLIAGKGHEDYQIIGDTKFPFDDRQVAREALQGGMP